MSDWPGEEPDWVDYTLAVVIYGTLLAGILGTLAGFAAGVRSIARRLR